MANNVWDNSDADNDGNNANNWSLGWVPKAGDTMYFDNTSDTDCTLSGNISCDAVNVTSDYDGTLDLNGNDLTTSGDMTFDGAGTVDCGEGVLTCSGHFDNQDQATWTYGTSTVVLDGTAKNLTGSSAKDLYNLTIDGTITIVAATTSGVDVHNDLVINNGKQITIDEQLRLVTGAVTNNGTIVCDDVLLLYGSTLTNSGTLSGTGTARIESGSSVTGTGTWSVSNTHSKRDNTFDGTTGTTYGGTWLLQADNGSRTLTLKGTITWSGDVTFDNDQGVTKTYTIDCSTHNPTLAFQGDLSLTATGGGAIDWGPGTGTITFSGSSNQSVDLNGDSVEDIVINKSGGVITFTDDFTCDSFQADAGDMDINGKTITSEGNVDINGGSAGAQFYDGAAHDMDNGKLICGSAGASALTLDGDVGEQLEIDNLDFDLQNASTGAATFCDVEDSDNATGTIDATAASNNDNGNNTGWNFGAAGQTYRSSHVIGGGIVA